MKLMRSPRKSSNTQSSESPSVASIAIAGIPLPPPRPLAMSRKAEKPAIGLAVATVLTASAAGA